MFQTNPEVNYLVPELCYLTGLSDRAHRDARVSVFRLNRLFCHFLLSSFQARKINRLVPFDSVGRQAEISYFDDLFRRNPSTIKYLASWGMDIASTLLTIHPPTVVPSCQVNSNRMHIVIRRISSRSLRNHLIMIQHRETMMENMPRKSLKKLNIPMDILQIQ